MNISNLNKNWSRALCVNIWLLLERHQQSCVSPWTHSGMVSELSGQVQCLHSILWPSKTCQWGSTIRSRTLTFPPEWTLASLQLVGNERNHQTAATASLMKNLKLLIYLMLISVYKRHQPSPNTSSARLHTDSQIHRLCCDLVWLLP